MMFALLPVLKEMCIRDRHHHAFLRLFLFLLRFGNLRLRLFGGLFRHGLLSLLFLLRGLFLGYGLLRLFRKRIGRRNFTHRGRCGADRDHRDPA